MVRAIIFGGTSEGRKLCEYCAKHSIPVLYSTATADGARQTEGLPGILSRYGALNGEEMAALIRQSGVPLVIDATHPFAVEASGNISAACASAAVRYARVKRESAKEPDCVYFDSYGALINWLDAEPGTVFVTTGAADAEAYTKLSGFPARVWIRVLPNADGLRKCVQLGYNPKNIICMQGPFPEDLNRATFLFSGARVLVTKDSGAEGGFAEKVRAARGLGMRVAALAKPEEAGGVSLEEAISLLRPLSF